VHLKPEDAELSPLSMSVARDHKSDFVIDR